MFGPALVRKHAVGVVGGIVPWNVPLFDDDAQAGAGHGRRLPRWC